jgi:hypothetical protein
MTRAAEPPALRDGLEALCVPSAQLTQPDRCAPGGPGTYAAELASAFIPNDIAPLPAERLPRPEKVLDLTYARVTVPEAPVFATPEEAAAGTVARTLGTGFVFVNLTQSVQAGEQTLYRTRAGQYIRAGDVAPVEPSTWQGLALTARPERPFGWMVKTVRPSALPGSPTPKVGQRRFRGELIEIFGAVRAGAWEWYLIGPGQWVEQRTVSVVQLNPPPEGVTGRWVQVNLFEQNMVAYEGSQPVYATLISSGLDKWATEPGLFQVYARVPAGKMSGAYAPDKSDYYFLEAVPWVMYFDGDRALHGQYWHDALGYKRSHGCVNLAPLDARWLYEWSSKGTYVWVYDPSQEVQAEAEASANTAEGP